MTIASIETAAATPTVYGVRDGLDIPVTVTLDDGRVVVGEALVIPDAINGGFTVYNENQDVAYWLSGNLVVALDDCDYREVAAAVCCAV